MPKIKIELNTSKTNADGRHPIYITVTKIKTRAYLTIGAASVNEWDADKKLIRKTKKTHLEDNIHLEDQWYKYKKIYDELNKTDEWEPKDVFAVTKKEKIKEKTFYEHADDYLLSLKGNEGSMGYDTIGSRIKKIKRYAKPDLKISDIDNKWLSGLVLHCKTKEKSKSGGIGNSRNTINHLVKLIKTIVNFSRQTNWDLASYKISFTKNVKQKLNESELKLLINADLRPNTLAYHSRNIFIAQYYMRGMRIGDMLRLKKSNIKEDKIYYTAGKTNVIHQVKIVPALKSLLAEYMEGDGYLFPFIRNMDYDAESFKNEIKNRTMVINRNLKKVAAMVGIEKTVSTHIARHTFASIADKKLGGDLKDLQAMLGHSSRAMTEIYIRDLRKYDEMDEIADKLFD